MYDQPLRRPPLPPGDSASWCPPSGAPLPPGPAGRRRRALPPPRRRVRPLDWPPPRPRWPAAAASVSVPHRRAGGRQRPAAHRVAASKQPRLPPPVPLLLLYLPPRRAASHPAGARPRRPREWRAVRLTARPTWRRAGETRQRGGQGGSGRAPSSARPFQTTGQAPPNGVSAMQGDALASACWLHLPTHLCCHPALLLARESAQGRTNEKRKPSRRGRDGRRGEGPALEEKTDSLQRWRTVADGGGFPPPRREDAAPAQREIDQWRACRGLTAVKRPPAGPRGGLTRRQRAGTERRPRGAVFWVGGDTFGGVAGEDAPKGAPRLARDLLQQPCL